VSWDNPTDRAMVGPKFLREMEENIEKIKHNLKVSQENKRSCVDKGGTHRDFKVGDHVLLKVKDKTSYPKLGNCSKLEAHYCGSLEILERIGLVAYILALPTSMCSHNVFHISFLKKYLLDANWIGKSIYFGIKQYDW
jgi:hypothetical protein